MMNKNKVSEIAFFLTVPLFLIYQYLISLKSIPPFFGGYLGIVYPLVFSMVFFAYLLFELPNKTKFKKLNLLVLSLFSYMVFVFIHGYAYGASTEIVKGHIAGVIYSALFFIVFSRLNVNGRFFKKALFFSFITIVLMFFYSFDLKKMAVSYLNEDYYFSYQYMAVSVFIIASLVIFHTKFIYLRFLIFIISLAVLFFNGARTEFAYFCAFYFLYEVSISYKTLNLYAGVFVVILLALYLLFYSDVTFTNNRVLNLLENGVFSGSGGERLRMFKDALVVIERSPLFGSYAAYQPGEYAHSIISLWSDFGIASFFLFLFILGARTFIDLKNYFNGSNNNYSNFIFALSLPMLPILIFAKNHDFLLLWFYLGLSVTRHHEGHAHA